MIGRQKNVVLAGAIGNALEWYDFTIYAFFVPIIAAQFFPNKDPFLSLIATFGVFAVGFLVRPLGALLFGYIGDHVGRKRALITSMVVMSFPTFLIGVLPNFHQIGLLAPLLLIGLRVVQGLAVSGELTTATVFLIEHADLNKRGLAGSLAMVGALLGMLLSSVLATFMSSLVSDLQLAEWGWRIPFLLGGLLGILGLIIRLRSVEPAIYEQVQVSQQKVSLMIHLKSLSVRTLCYGVCITSIMAIANYFLIAYFNTFLVENQGLPLRSVMWINTIAITVQLLNTLLMGHLSDKLGRAQVLGAGMFSLALFAIPVFWLLTQRDVYMALLGEVLFAIAAGALTGSIPTRLAEMFDTYHRNMGISVSYNISLALFGGTAPLVAMTLVSKTNHLYAPAFYLIVCAMVAIKALFELKGCRHKGCDANQCYSVSN